MYYHPFLLKIFFIETISSAEAELVKDLNAAF